MTLVEQFEKHINEMRPCEPYSESENPEQWASVLAWQEGYSKWLETKLQNTSSNSEYPKCSESYDGEHHYQNQPVCVYCGHLHNCKRYMQAQEIKDLIVSYCEGSTDNVSDGVLYNELAEAIVEKFTSTKNSTRQLKDAILRLIMDDVYACSWQTMGQYRSGLIKEIEKLLVV